MLEERLSNTYSQHNIGSYNLPLQQQGNDIYPSIQTNISNGQSGAESFYTGTTSQDLYGRPQATYNYAPPQQYPSPYPMYDQRNYLPSAPQRTGSWQPSSPTPTTYGQSSRVPESAGQPTVQPHLIYANSETPISPIAESNAQSYYANTANTSAHVQTNPTEQNQNQYQVMQSPVQHLANPQPQQQFLGHPESQQPPYWQVQQQNAVAQHAWEASAPSQSNYSKDSFPAAPQHNLQPQSVPVEESLIEF